jgi:leader peptidase (prepilin peptidase) / N-methyltransferase
MNMADTIIAVFFFLCWGSFLNVVAYRLLREQSPFAGRSCCPHCNAPIAWYDLIPLFSYCLLAGKCRHCHAVISPLYPFVESLTALFFYALITCIDQHYWIGYGIFFSALIVVIRTDLEMMLIPSLVTLYAIPLGVLLSLCGMLPLAVLESIVGAASAYFFLYTVFFIYRAITKREGIGWGDIELLGFIGAFLGVQGWWVAMLIGSLSGSLIGILYLAVNALDARTTPLPFGPFLALGAILYVLYGPVVLSQCAFIPTF